MAPKRKLEATQEAPAPAATPKVVEAKPATSGSITVTIEHCKQCQVFKRKADEMVKHLTPLLETKGEKPAFVYNPEKPRKGYFAVHIKAKDGENKTFYEIGPMLRPFPKLREANLEAVAADIVTKFSGKKQKA